MKLKTGKTEIVYLIEKVFEKYELETGKVIKRNTSKSNYEGVAVKLSKISNQLPFTAELNQHDFYQIDNTASTRTYPSRKYDITSSQIKDAFYGFVSNPKSFFVDACYIYLFNVGRKGFEENPIDKNLLSDDTSQSDTDFVNNFLNEKNEIESKTLWFKKENKKQIKLRIFLFLSVFFLMFLLLLVSFLWYRDRIKIESEKKDLNILPYLPSPVEIDSLEGVWLCYTGSPQARSSDPNRYHMVVSNIVNVIYKNGYFTFNRYGASFDHWGYMQFEAPWLVSVYSCVKNDKDSVQSPRHSLMNLNSGHPYINVISASWNFDTGRRNQIIGIREVYIKLGRKGTLNEIINTVENSSCKCKIIQWHRPDSSVETFALKNQLLDTLSNPILENLLNEKSIILAEPQQGLIISDSMDEKKGKF